MGRSVLGSMWYRVAEIAWLLYNAGFGEVGPREIYDFGGDEYELASMEATRAAANNAIKRGYIHRIEDPNKAGKKWTKAYYEPTERAILVFSKKHNQPLPDAFPRGKKATADPQQKKEPQPRAKAVPPVQLKIDEGTRLEVNRVFLIGDGGPYVLTCADFKRMREETPEKLLGYTAYKTTVHEAIRYEQQIIGVKA